MQPYKQSLKPRSQELRNNQTLAEYMFWHCILKRPEFAQYTWRRQKPLLGFIADFYCSKLLLVVEIDGKIHETQRVADIERTALLTHKLNVRVVRFTNEQVLLAPTEVARSLSNFIHQHPIQYKSSSLQERAG